MKIICFLITILIGILPYLDANMLLKPTDLCAYNQYKCANWLNNTVRCERNRCSGKWKNPCDNDFCSKNAYACHMYKLKNIFYEKNSNRKNTSISNKKMNEYLKLKQSINSCPTSEIEQWSLNDVCVGNLECQLDCDCPSQLSIKCNDYICGTNEKVCSQVMEMLLEGLLNRGNSAKVSLKKC